MLWSIGNLFGGIVAFIFADLVIAGLFRGSGPAPAALAADWGGTAEIECFAWDCTT